MGRERHSEVATPLLSLLIPAYENADGVLRILRSIPPILRYSLEVIVSDDSKTSVVRDCLEQWNTESNFQVRYTAHISTGNPVDNWNYLLGQARGEYTQLMHHDEWPYSEGYFEELFHILEFFRYDVCVLDCALFQFGKIRRHSSFNLKRYIIINHSDLLISRNIIGSPSNLVIRRKKTLRFDTALQWSVDIEFYVRLFACSKSIYISRDIMVGSDLNASESITSSIKSKLKAIKKAESLYIFETLNHIKPNLIITMLLHGAHIIEQCFYRIFKIGYYK